MNVSFTLNRILLAISTLLFLIAVVGHFIGLSGQPNTLLLWGLVFFSAGHWL